MDLKSHKLLFAPLPTRTHTHSHTHPTHTDTPQKHTHSYAHSKGLFFGASLEASGIAARPDVNRKFYGQKLSPSVLLSG
jgi:lipid-binding SYLF domain-containing protein